MLVLQSVSKWPARAESEGQTIAAYEVDTRAPRGYRHQSPEIE
jgi:hypothetical protein